MKYLKKKKSLPDGFKRDYGCGMSSHPYLFHMNADCIYHKKSIERKIKFIKKVGAECIYCDTTLCYDIYNKDLYKTESVHKIYESTLFHTREFWKRRGFQWSDIEYEGKYFHYNNGVDRKLDNYYDKNYNLLTQDFIYAVAIHLTDYEAIPEENRLSEDYTIPTITILSKEIVNCKYLKKEHSDKFSILVLGGSQGAEIFGTIIPPVIKMIKDLNYEIEIIQQCVAKQKSEITNFYKKNNIKNYVFEFDSNILKLVSSTNMAITRCGASTMAELIYTFIPFIAVPLPNSID